MLAAKNGTVIAADIYGKIKSFVLDVACMVCMLYLGLASIFGNAVDFIRIIGLIGVVAGAVLALISCINYTVNAKDLILESLNDKKPENKETAKIDNTEENNKPEQVAEEKTETENK